MQEANRLLTIFICVFINNHVREMVSMWLFPLKSSMNIMPEWLPECRCPEREAKSPVRYYSKYTR